MVDQLENAIDRTVQQFQQYPLDFLSERDIQAWLFVELRNAPSGRYSYDAKGDNFRFGFREPFCVYPVTTEYYIGKGKRDRFDIAVLSEEPDSTSAIWCQPCRVAIEIKLWQPGYGEPNHRKDVEKLRQYQGHLQKSFTGERPFTGIAMLFVHPCAEKLMGIAISEEDSGDAYPENGIALHFVTQRGHWWKQQFPAPSIPIQVDSFAQTP